MNRRPSVVVLSGPNGAGKTTASRALLVDGLGIHEFVNADAIAQGLSAFAPETSAVAAGRILLTRIRELAAQRQDFAFETTLATRTFAPWLAQLAADGWDVHVVFLYLPSPDAAVLRVRERVATGGHSIPEGTIRRRWRRGLENLVRLYLPVASQWVVLDASGLQPQAVARGARGGTPIVYDEATWERIRSCADAP